MVNRKLSPRQTFCQMILVIGLLFPALLGASAPAIQPMVVQPLLLEMANREPNAIVPVIVQVAGPREEIMAAVARLGGNVTRDLHIINAFTAQLAAHAIPALAKEDTVRWISLDAPVQETALLGTEMVATAWATEFGWKSSATAVTKTHFKDKPIPAGSTIWFNSAIVPEKWSTLPATVRFMQGQVHFTAAGVEYHLDVPDALFTIGASFAEPMTFYNTVDERWETQSPSAIYSSSVLNTLYATQETFLTGLAFPVVNGLPAKIQNVYWTGRFESSDPSLKIKWRTAAAVYTSFDQNYNSLQVRPFKGDVKNNLALGDNAGTPVAYKAALIPGGTGDKAGNYTGDYKDTGVTPQIPNIQRMLSSDLGPDEEQIALGKMKDVLGGFSVAVTPGHAIKKVEIALSAYVDKVPTGVEIKGKVYSVQKAIDGEVKQVEIEQFVTKNPIFNDAVGPANAKVIYIDITSVYPWMWKDLIGGLELEFEQKKPEEAIVHYNAVGLRITSVPGADLSWMSMYTTRSARYSLQSQHIAECL